jgi:hypothetical protein
MVVFGFEGATTSIGGALSDDACCVGAVPQPAARTASGTSTIALGRIVN